MWVQILPYSIGLVGLTESPSGEDVSLIGSGTLIQVGKTRGILTAEHVVSSDCYKEAKYLGLVFLSHVHKFIIEKQYVKVIEVAKSREPSRGPDLSVIVLPEAKIPWINANKRFWNISTRRNKILSNPLDKDIGLWFLSGFPDHFTRIEEPRLGFNKVKGFCNMFGWSGVENEWLDGEFDYIDIPVLYEDETSLPRSFGGVSGGGIWQVPLFEGKGGVIEGGDPIFSGVAFYQTDIENNRRTIRCHGRRSVYGIVYNILNELH